MSFGITLDDKVKKAIANINGFMLGAPLSVINGKKLKKAIKPADLFHDCVCGACEGMPVKIKDIPKLIKSNPSKNIDLVEFWFTYGT